MTEHAKTLDEIADLFGVTKKSLHNFKHDGMMFPPKTAKGYNIERFKANFEKYKESKCQAGTGLDLKEQKLTKEIERLSVNISIDNERLTQQKLETKRQHGLLMEVKEHNRICDAYMHLYLNGLDQLKENVSTRLRSAEASEVLQSGIDSVRTSISERAN